MQDQSQPELQVPQESEEKAPEEEEQEEFYTEGIPQLLDARKDIARWSIPRAKERIERQRKESQIPLRTHIQHRRGIKEKFQKFEMFGSQVTSERPVGICRFAPSGQTIAAGNWGGGIKLLKVPTLEENITLRGHTDRVGGISWAPGATLPSSNVSNSALNLASGGAEGNVHLWSLEQDTPIGTLAGHFGRVCRVDFHPSGRYLASASYDTTWRLWDVEKQQELLLQEGHSREVYCASFNIDGSLLASGGLDSIGRIWDLRVGRTVMILEGHAREIYGMDWGNDGYRVLSGSADGWVKCWDLRRVQESAGFGAHQSIVSDLRWYKGDSSGSTSAMEIDAGSQPQQTQPSNGGSFFISSGFDKHINIFSTDDWALIKSLSGHSGNILSVDIAPDMQWIASSGHDRTVKLWGVE